MRHAPAGRRLAEHIDLERRGARQRADPADHGVRRRECRRRLDGDAVAVVQKAQAGAERKIGLCPGNRVAEVDAQLEPVGEADRGVDLDLGVARDVAKGAQVEIEGDGEGVAEIELGQQLAEVDVQRFGCRVVGNRAVGQIEDGGQPIDHLLHAVEGGHVVGAQQLCFVVADAFVDAHHQHVVRRGRGRDRDEDDLLHRHGDRAAVERDLELDVANDDAVGGRRFVFDCVGARRAAESQPRAVEVDRRPRLAFDLEADNRRVDDLKQQLVGVEGRVGHAGGAHALNHQHGFQAGGGERRVEVAGQTVGAILQAISALVVKQAASHRVGKAENGVDRAFDEGNVDLVEEAALAQVVELFGEPADQADDAGGVDVAEVGEVELKRRAESEINTVRVRQVRNRDLHRTVRQRIDERMPDDLTERRHKRHLDRKYELGGAADGNVQQAAEAAEVVDDFSQVDPPGDVTWRRVEQVDSDGHLSWAGAREVGELPLVDADRDEAQTRCSFDVGGTQRGVQRGAGVSQEEPPQRVGVLQFVEPQPKGRVKHQGRTHGCIGVEGQLGQVVEHRQPGLKPEGLVGDRLGELQVKGQVRGRSVVAQPEGGRRHAQAVRQASDQALDRWHAADATDATGDWVDDLLLEGRRKVDDRGQAFRKERHIGAEQAVDLRLEGGQLRDDVLCADVEEAQQRPGAGRTHGRVDAYVRSAV